MKSKENGLKRGHTLKFEANKIREAMARQGVDTILQELLKIPDQAMVDAVARHVKIKIKLF